MMLHIEPKLKLAMKNRRWLRVGISRGQSMVEFALIAPVVLALMVVGVQYAIIGQSALAVSQGASAIARYAAVNPGTVGGSSGNGTVTLNGTTLQNLLSPNICGGSCGSLTASIASTSAATGSATTAQNPPQFGDQLQITLRFDATNEIVLPSTTLLGISFPTNLTGTASAVYE